MGGTSSRKGAGRGVPRAMAEMLEGRRLLSTTYVWWSAPAFTPKEGNNLQYMVNFYWDGGLAPNGTVSIACGGSATQGEDYELSTTSVTIPPNPNYWPGGGAIPVLVQFQPDNVVEDPPEELQLTLSCNVPGIVWGPPSVPPHTDRALLATATRTILDDPPIVSIGVLDGNATEQNPALGDPYDPGQVLLSRTGGDIASSLTVKLEVVGGTAPSSRYTLPESVTFAPGSRTAVADIVPVDDAEAQGVQTVEVTVAPSTPDADGHLSYNLADRMELLAVIRLDDNVSVRLPQAVAHRDSGSLWLYGYYLDYMLGVTGEHTDLVRAKLTTTTTIDTWDAQGNKTTQTVQQVTDGLIPIIPDENPGIVGLLGVFPNSDEVTLEVFNGAQFGVANYAVATTITRRFDYELTTAFGHRWLMNATWGYTWTNTISTENVPNLGYYAVEPNNPEIPLLSYIELNNASLVLIPDTAQVIMAFQLITFLLLGCTWALAATTEPTLPDEVADRAAGQLSVELFVPPDASVANMEDTYVVIKVLNPTNETVMVPAAPDVTLGKVDAYQSRRRRNGWWLGLVIQPPAGPGPTLVSGYGLKPITLSPHAATLHRARFSLTISPAGTHRIRAVLGHDKRIVAQSEIATMERLPAR